MTSDTDLWWVPEHLLDIRHTPILTPTLARNLFRVDRRSLQAAVVGRRVR
jgi:hypothetical protein